MRPIINGLLGPILTERSVSFNRTSGMIVRQRYRSAGNGLQGVFQQCVANNIECDYRPSDHVSEIEISTSDTSDTGGSTVVPDTWELLCNEISY
ncbi:MAG: hypothetical protein ACEQSB_07480, partial [Undibacterium sp.]